MCMLCYEFAPEDQWSDGASDGAVNAPPGRPRYRRTQILCAVLAPYGLAVSDPGSGPHLVVADHKGAAEVAAGLPAIWQAADRLSSRQVDVLDPALLEDLMTGGRA
jgi:hypothetical protein